MPCYNVNPLHLNFTRSLFRLLLPSACCRYDFNPTEAGELSDFILSGEEDNGGAFVNNRNINNEINGNWLSSSSNTIQEARLKAKAKRRLRKNSSRDSGRGDSLSDNGDVSRGTSAVPTSPKSKLMDRKSRMGKGRGLPKKGMVYLFLFFSFVFGTLSKVLFRFIFSKSNVIIVTTT